jgi:hypothetical protein
VSECHPRRGQAAWLADFFGGFRIMKRLRILFSLLVVALLLASCAAKLPKAEVDSANAAFAEAQTVQADILAADSFAAAVSANEALQANLNAKEYGKSKALAKALLEASKKASAEALAGLEAAKVGVAQLGTDIAAEIAFLQKGYKAAVAKKAKNVNLQSAKKAIDAAPKALADAQSLSDVVASKAALDSLKVALDSIKTAFEAAGIKE